MEGQLMNEPGHPTLGGADRDRLHQAAGVLLEARRTLEPLDDLPLALRPRTLDEAYYVQDAMLQALGEVGGWKVGAPAPDAIPRYAPMPIAGFAQSGSAVAVGQRRLRGVEAEIAYRLGKDLPSRPEPYTRQELVDAIASCHPAIELLESALLDPDAADPLTGTADLQSHGGFVYGEPVKNWSSLDLGDEKAQMNVDGFIRVTDGRNSAGSDLLRMVLWLVNEAQQRTGGLRAGQWITTGSWTGKILTDSGSVALARFSSFGEVSVRFD